jgi:hypothetical protein
MDLYHYTEESLNHNLEELSENNFIKEYKLTYDSPYRSGLEENDRAYTRLFLNKDKTGKKNDLLIVVHGFSTGKPKLKKYYRFINQMNSNNLSCAFINLPFHLNRTPRGEKSGERLRYFDDIQTLLFFHQSVVDIKKLIDILPEIAKFNKIYICGISLGSMISLITMANDNRIDKCVLLIGGGKWEEIHWGGVLRFVLRGSCVYKNKRYSGKIRREVCREIYSNFPLFLKKIKELNAENIKINLENLPELKEVTPKMCFLCDPLAFAYKVDTKKVFMVNSRFDLYFNKKSTTQLWEELGKPKIFWINKLHSSSIIINKKIAAGIKNFLLNS